VTTTLPTLRAEEVARRWLEVDPDPGTRAETEQLLTDGGAALERRFGGRLAFGTAGLRGPLGAGPMRMNRVLVRMTAAAIGRRLLAGAPGAATDSGPPPVVVVGFDARRNSDVFAEDTARMLAGLGIASLVLPRPLPTPVLAFTLRNVGADAGIMVTASHNPRTDNGYKVYWSDGAQIVPPVDSEVSALIDGAPLPTDADLAAGDDPLIERAGEAEVGFYTEAATSVVDTDSPRDLSIVYTPLHGVGRDVLLEAFRCAGFAEPAVVPEQGEPDPDFPTLPYPNPEEPGALDLATALAAREGADLVLANDPDADRLAVAVPDGPGWRTLTGDEVGALLADHVLGSGSGDDRLVVTTVVSSRLLARIAGHHGVRHAETLTGFKWIMRPGLDDPSADFVFGYEEAAGYAVGDLVRDKDGITRTGLRTIRFAGPDGAADMARRMDLLRSRPPSDIAGHAVVSVTDMAGPGSSLPPTDALVFELDGGRLVIRPSGTEPMLKAYAEVIGPSAEIDPRSSERAGDLAVSGMLDGVCALLGGSSR